MRTFNLVLILVSVSACGKGAPIQPPCYGPANSTSQIHYFGDSITHGGGNNDANGNPFGYAQMFAQDNNLTIDDKAVAASVIAGCGQLPSILGSKIQPNQTYVYFTGTNDAHMYGEGGLASFTADFQTAYNYLSTTPGNTLLFMGPYYAAGDDTPALRAVIDDYNDAIQKIAGPLYLDLRPVITSNAMLTDGLHPNATGHRAIEAAVQSVLH